MKNVFNGEEQREIKIEANTTPAQISLKLQWEQEQNRTKNNNKIVRDETVEKKNSMRRPCGISEMK